VSLVTLDTRIQDLSATVRTKNCLWELASRPHNFGHRPRGWCPQTVRDLVRMAPAEAMCAKGFGEATLKEVTGILRANGLDWNMDIPDKPKVEFPGVGKRELFAAMCLQGLLANNWSECSAPKEVFAADAVGVADALLAELEKEEGDAR